MPGYVVGQRRRQEQYRARCFIRRTGALADSKDAVAVGDDSEEQLETAPYSSYSLGGEPNESQENSTWCSTFRRYPAVRSCFVPCPTGGRSGISRRQAEPFQKPGVGWSDLALFQRAAARYILRRLTEQSEFITSIERRCWYFRATNHWLTGELIDYGAELGLATEPASQCSP